MAIAETACADVRKAFGKPDAGNPHVRFEEGGGSHLRSSSTRLLQRFSCLVPELCQNTLPSEEPPYRVTEIPMPVAFPILTSTTGVSHM